MNCPSCGAKKNKLKVTDSRPTEEGASIRRRRKCTECGHRFSTSESLDVRNIKLIKRDNRREDFDSDKLRASIDKVIAKRPIADEDIQALVSDVKNKALLHRKSELQSFRIAQWTMQGLQGLDRIAFIRYASSYRNFKDMGSSVTEIRYLQDNPNQISIFKDEC